MVTKTLYPSFRGLYPASVKSSRAKRANRATNTKPEILLRSALRGLGLRFKVNHRRTLGVPDVAFLQAKVAIFCDGDFWHGRHWNRLEALLSRRANAQYWVAKIAANRQRDRQVVRELTGSGWRVLRVWETDVKADPLRTAMKIAARLPSQAPQGRATAPPRRKAATPRPRGRI